MSTFDERAGMDLNTILTQLPGDLATYTPVDGDPVQVTTYFVETKERIIREDGTGLEETATVLLGTDALGIDGIPVIGDTITHGAVIWTVRSIPWAKHNIAAVECERQTAKTAHRRGHYLRE